MGHLSTLFLLAGVIGICILQLQEALPPHGGLSLVLGILLLFPVLALARWGRWSMLAWGLALLAGGLAGFGWAAWRAEVRLADALDPAWEGQDIRISGQVAALPQPFERGVRFEFRVTAVETPGARIPERLWLSVYQDREAEEGAALPAFRAGEAWALTVRLKRPHGSVNPGGFDYEAWLLERDLRATGYVRSAPVPERLEAFVAWPPMNGVHRLRQQLRERFLRHLGEAPYGGILVALAIGDQGAIHDDLWELFRRTGITHLMAISGLHVTLIATLLGMLVNWGWRCFPRLCRRWPAYKAALCCGWLSALGYALLAGMGIPAQRTCLMLTAAVMAMVLDRQVGAGRILLLALVGVLLFDPWAVLAAGFWLSFATVAALLWIGLAGMKGCSGRWRHWLEAFGRTQWAATLATLPVLLWLFQQFPLISPLANLLAIPLVSFVITPLTLLAMVCPEGLQLLLLKTAHGLLTFLLGALEYGAGWPTLQIPATPLTVPLLAALGVFIMLMPRGVPGRGAGLLMLLPLLFWIPPRLESGQLRATVLDVGQGQAVLLETAGHSLLYDAGPGYGSSDAGQRVVLPYLQGRGLTGLDMLVVSHQDSDHAGGLDSLRAALPVRELVTSIPELGTGLLCQQHMAWEWDGVHFAFLHPPSEQALRGRNEDSCVLRVETPAGRLLLTGDIGIREEARLLARERERLSAEVLLMPHHGSASSSSLPFVAAVGPQLALASVGYRNRFNHPRPEVLERYQGLGAQVWRTDRDGALLLDFAAGRIALRAWRQEQQRYWRGR